MTKNDLHFPSPQFKTLRRERDTVGNFYQHIFCLLAGGRHQHPFDVAMINQNSCYPRLRNLGRGSVHRFERTYK